MVAKCIARLTVKQFCVPLPTVCCMYFVFISEQSAIISLTELSVFRSLGGVCYYTVGTEYLNVRVLTFAYSLPAAHRVPLCFSCDSRNNIDSLCDNINGRVVLMESKCVFCEI